MIPLELKSSNQLKDNGIFKKGWYSYGKGERHK